MSRRSSDLINRIPDVDQWIEYVGLLACVIFWGMVCIYFARMMGIQL